MAKTANLETREQRAKLKPQHEPYWRTVERGMAIGYRRAGSGAGVWYVREHRGGSYTKRRVALARTIHEGAGFQDHACKFGGVGA